MGYLLILVGLGLLAYAGYRILAHRQHAQPAGSDTASGRPDTVIKDGLFGIFGIIVVILGVTLLSNMN